MVFITKYNANHIYHSLDKEKLDKIYAEDLYEVSLWMFSLSEKRWLAAAKMFFQSTEFFIEHFFNEVETEEKSDWVFSNTTPSFHFYRDCTNLTSDYFNLKIPVEIVARGDKEKQKFREWFKENKKLLDENSERFLTRMEATFILRNRPRIEEFRANNSGVEEAENLNIDNIKNKIGNLIKEMENLNNNNVRLINEFGKRTHLVMNDKIVVDNPEDKKVLKFWHDLKSDLKKNLRVYFMLRFNPDLEFKESVLETIGFKPCNSCATRKLLIGE